MLNMPVELLRAASWWVAWGTLVVIALLLLMLVVLGMANRRETVRQQQFQSRWRPLLMQVALGDAVPSLPALKARDRLRLLKLWVHLQLSLRGQARDRLAALGMQLGLDGLAQRWLRKGHRAEQLLALLVMGYLRHESLRPGLRAPLAHPSSALALHAGWALLCTAPAEEADAVADQLLTRHDLDWVRVSVLMREHRTVLAPRVIRRLQTLGQDAPQGTTQDVARSLAQALKLAGALRLQLAPEVLQPVLAPGQTPDVLMAALRLVQEGTLADAVRALVTHPAWPVRAQVARTLGRIGQEADVQHLLVLLTDAQWWVRYRAAQALAALPCLPRPRLQVLVEGLSDRYARDMVQQVLVELPE